MAYANIRQTGNANPPFKVIRFISIAVVFILAATVLSPAESIRVGIFDFEPLVRTSPPEQAGGLFVELLEHIAAREGWRLHFVAGTLAECRERLERGDIDLLPAAAYSQEKETRYAFTRETVISTWAQVYSLDQYHLQSVIQLDNRTVGVLRDDLYNQELRRIIKGFDIRVTFVEFAASAEIFKALKERWIDAGVVDRLYGIRMEAPGNVRQTPVIFSPVELRFAAAIDGRRNLADTLDYHLTRLKKDPNSIYYRLVDQVLGEKKNARIPGFVSWILGTAVGLLMLFVGVSFLLHRQVEVKTKELSRKNRELQTEIRERERTEEALLESEEKFRLISEESLMAIAIIQEDEIKYANQAFARLTEYPLEEILRWKTGEYARLLHPDDSAFVLEQSRKKQQGETDVVNHYSYRIFSKPGKTKWVEHYSRTILFQGNYASLLTAAEITETMETMEKLAAEKERLAVTLRSIGDGVITTDKNGDILLVNRMAETITGWKQEEAQGLAVTRVFQVKDEKTGAFREDPVRRVMESGSILDLANDGILVARNGGEHIILSNCAPIRDKDQQIIGAVLVFHDITEKRKMELEIQKALKLESLGVLAAGIAHDFNNLLAIIMGNIGLAKRSLSPGDPALKILDDAEKGAFSATGLSRQLLTFARGNAPVKETASIREMIEGSTQFALRGSAVRCDCHFHPKLYSAAVDKGQISQVFQNLIINAEQAMPRGGLITIRADNLDNHDRQKPFLHEGKYLEIVIRDQGVGIPQEYLDKIFDPFFTTKQKGNGLGLSVVYSIIKKHDGHIRVESQLGKGTVFYIYLPATSEPYNPGAPEQEGILTGSGTILVMDDNEAILEMLGAMLEEFGYTPAFARKGEEALQLYRAALHEGKPYTAVIMDLTIAGGMGGKETIARLREIDPGVKAIVSSGYATDTVVANYKDFGFQGVINKPFRLAQLSQVLHRVVKIKYESR